MKPTNPNQAIMTKEGEVMVKKPGCRLVGKGFYFVRTTGKSGTCMISPTSGSKVVQHKASNNDKRRRENV